MAVEYIKDKDKIIRRVTETSMSDDEITGDKYDEALEHLENQKKGHQRDLEQLNIQIERVNERIAAVDEEIAELSALSIEPAPAPVEE